MFVYIFIFFFSSRRRHTRWPRDWSSDVCSSDLMDAEMQIFDFIEGWYNPHRRHSAIGYLSPINYERQHLTQTKNQTKNSPRKRGNFNENIFCLWRLCLLPLAFVVDSDCVVAVVVFSYLVLSYSFTDAGTRHSPRKAHVIISRF